MHSGGGKMAPDKKLANVVMVADRLPLQKAYPKVSFE